MSHTDQVLRAVDRKVSVKGPGGVAATVVVMAQRGQVWVSIQPPFTWEAIMEPGKVDELMHTLGLAREDAQRMVSGKRVSHGDNNNQSATSQCYPATSHRHEKDPAMIRKDLADVSSRELRSAHIRYGDGDGPKLIANSDAIGNDGTISDDLVALHAAVVTEVPDGD